MAKTKAKKKTAKKAGQPRKFKDEKTMIQLFTAFCDFVRDEQFVQIPSQSNFCRWLSQNYQRTDRKTIYNSLNKYFPTIKKEFEVLQSDVIAEGAMLGKYNATMAIFALKNWCKWSDKPIDEGASDYEDLTPLAEMLK